MSRERILARVRQALEGAERSPLGALPDTARIPRRAAGDPEAEMDRFFEELRAVAGHGGRVDDSDDLDRRLAELVANERIGSAVIAALPWLQKVDIEGRLAKLGVKTVPAHSDTNTLAACDLGVTGVEAALPETGTLVLRDSPEQPGSISLLPRVHLALLLPSGLLGDLAEAFELFKEEKHFFLVTGPSRTADIEKTLAIGMHGPKALYVWRYAP